MEYEILAHDNLAGVLELIRLLGAEGWVVSGGLAYGKRAWAVLMTRDPLAKALQAQNTSIFGGNGATEKP